MKKIIYLIAFAILGIESFAQGPTAPVKEIEIPGTIKFSETSSSNDPSTGTTTHKFTCLKSTDICLKINKPGLATGETIEAEQVPNGAIDVGTLITIEIPAVPSNPLYYGYFSSYSYSLDPLNSLEAEHTFVLVNP